MAEPIVEKPSEISLRNQVRAKHIAQGLVDGKTYTQIAKELGISRNTLYAVMGKHEVRELMTLEIRELETRLQDWITELHESPNSANKRHATSELGKIVKHVQDKLYPSLFRSENITVNIDLTELQQREHRFTKALNNIPPTCREAFWEAYNIT